MDYIRPSFPVLHCLPEFAQTHAHWVDEAIQILSSIARFFSCPQSFPSSESSAILMLNVCIIVRPTVFSWVDMKFWKILTKYMVQARQAVSQYMLRAEDEQERKRKKKNIKHTLKIQNNQFLVCVCQILKVKVKSLSSEPPGKPVKYWAVSNIISQKLSIISNNSNESYFTKKETNSRSK